MGKKKSVVLLTLITIVMLILCAVVAFPSFTIPGSNGIKKWNPTVMQYDLSGDFSGGHYAYYYPEGVITEAEYEKTLEGLPEEERQEHIDAYKKHGSLYLSVADEDLIFADGNYDEVSEDFIAAFDEAVKVVSDRFAKRAQYTGSTFRVSVVDDYAIRVQLSASENSKEQNSGTYAYQAFAQYANLGDLTFDIDGEIVEQMADGESANGLIKKVTAKTKYEVSYVHIKFTNKGEKMLKAFKKSDGSKLNLKIGDETIMEITADSINSKNEVEFGIGAEDEKLATQTVCALINSAINEGAIYVGENEEAIFSLKAPTSSQVYTYEPAQGDTLVWVYVAILAVIVALGVFAIVKMRGFGVMNLYTTLTYFLITAICFAFITDGVFVVSFGTIFTFLAGLILTNVIHAYIYDAIKSEAKLGKTVQSSVKNGYKKTLWTVIDLYAVLLLGSIALLFGVASVSTLASQATICILTGAFCNLLWGRFINVALLSCSKDKYKYFHFVREDDDDDE